MLIKPSSENSSTLTKLIKGAVVPRPIAWISTKGSNGVTNLAPFSYFNIISHKPIMFMISIGGGIQAGNDSNKDTLANILDTNEFVINLVTQELAVQMQKSSIIFPSDVSEFSETGLTPIDSELIKAPRIKEAKVSIECTLVKKMELGDFSQIIGQLSCLHVADEVLLGTDKINYKLFHVIGRMAANYTTTKDVFFPEV